MKQQGWCGRICTRVTALGFRGNPLVSRSLLHRFDTQSRKCVFVPPLAYKVHTKSNFWEVERL